MFVPSIFLFNIVYCQSQGFEPKTIPGTINYVGECGSEGYLCKECEGDCDSDDDCEGDLICRQRSEASSVPGCSGEGGSRDLYGKDVCYDPNLSNPPEVRNSLKISADGCNSATPCEKCEGTCTSSSDCDPGLECLNRIGTSPVPGCVTGGDGDISGANYCYEVPPDGPVTYVPGELSVSESGLRLSTGLTAKIIARSGQPVPYNGGGSSSRDFHEAPDGAALFEDDRPSNPGG